MTLLGRQSPPKIVDLGKCCIWGCKRPATIHIMNKNHACGDHADGLKKTLAKFNSNKENNNV